MKEFLKLRKQMLMKIGSEAIYIKVLAGLKAWKSVYVHVCLLIVHVLN